MSQAGIAEVLQSFPQIPVQFNANSGSAIPIANILNIVGSNGITTTGAGSTITVTGINATAAASVGLAQIGVAAFDSTDFTVTAGFVKLLGSGAAETLTGNTGGAISPVGNNINTVGTGSITIAGAGNTLTTQLTGLTANAVLYGQGTATVGLLLSGTTGQVLQTNTGAAPTYSSATYPSSTTVSQILYSSANNIVTGLATANRAVLTTGATGIPVLTPIALDGQIIVGSTAGAPAATTITAGTGISVTNASNSISIAVNGAVVGQTITGNDTLVVSPLAGNWNLTGTTANNGINLPVWFANNPASAGNVQCQIQVTAAVAPTPVNTNSVGLACFNNTDFTVNAASGMVSLLSTGAGKTITGQSGGALSPTAGNWNISGASTAAGTSPVVTSGSVSTLTVNVQKAQAIAAADATKVGLANFNSAQFTVDANGFVSTTPDAALLDYKLVFMFGGM